MARLIGPSNLPTGAVASGIWSMMQAQKSVGDFTWPTLLKQSGAVLALDFDETTSLDTRISFTRATSGTYFDSSGVLRTAASGQARFDHRLENGVWVNKGLLIEEQRTNVTLQSEALSNATYWNPVRCSVSADAITAPDGNSTADKVIEDSSASTSHFILPAVAYRPTLTASTTYTLSVFAKAGERTAFSLVATGSASWNPAFPSAHFDLSLGTVVSEYGSTATIQDCGNGWYRCAIIATLGASGGSATLQFNLMEGSSVNYNGDGSSGAYFWGAQLETGAFPTSYIKTTTASVTRNQDVAEMTSTNFSSWYNQTEGTVFLQVDRLAPVDSGFPVILSISNGTQNERLVFNYNSDPDYRFLGIDGNVVQFALEQLTSISAGTVGKLCGAYKVNDFAFSADGNSVLTDTSGTLPTPNKVNIGSNYAGNTPSQISGHIAKFYYWNTRRPDSFLQEITS